MRNFLLVVAFLMIQSIKAGYILDGIIMDDVEKDFSTWSLWSSCSVSCGEGVRQRHRICGRFRYKCESSRTQTKHCFNKFCPSYLTWPRMHFSGRMVADVNTVNNIRCAYENEKFSPSELSKYYLGLEKHADSHTYYKHVTGNWNPDGTNHIYFQDTFVTSFCSGPGKCSTTDPVVGLKVQEVSRGIMAVLDVDWQLATEIWGLKISIPGVLEGVFAPSSHQVERERIYGKTDENKGYSLPMMSRYKSKLSNVTWQDYKYAKLFNDAKELSITFVYDLFNQVSLEGRISGTIGLTSHDDPIQITATRVMHFADDSQQGMAPFYYHEDKRYLTIDMSASINAHQNGSFIPYLYGGLDLGVLLSKRTYCRYFYSSICNKRGDENEIAWTSITTGGEVSLRMDNNNEWYTTYGGLMDFDLSKVSKNTLRLLKYNRLALLGNDHKKQETLTYMSELPSGMSYGMMNRPISRLDPGQSHEYEAFVGSYGRPAKSVHVTLQKMANILGSADCGRSSCNRSMGVPVDALLITPNHPSSLTNASGLITLTVKAVKDPGNIRGCGLDGQVYPLRVLVSHRNPATGRIITYSDSYSSLHTGPKTINYWTESLSSAVKIYSSVKNIDCPTWDDVKSIFIQYYNLYPAMWKYGIIDLHSYEQVKKKSKILKASMFDTSMSDPRYMPISRDLSTGKKKLIWNWMKCGMKRFSQPKKDPVVCTTDYVKAGIEEIRRLLQTAVMLELSTIPPYITAWLSLKTEFGRNKEIANVLKSIFNEEMLHLSLAGNILNAVGGNVNLTDESKLPIYPTNLATGEFYELDPNVEVSIAPFSMGLVEDVFSEIEKPGNQEHKNIIYHIAELWKMLPNSKENADNGNTTTSGMRKLFREFSFYSQNSKANNYRTGDFEYSGRHLDNSNLTNTTESFQTHKNMPIHAWRSLGKVAAEKIKMISDIGSKSIGSFYTMIALKLTSLEACAQIMILDNKNHGIKENHRNLHGTVFTGDIKKQINMSQWYRNDGNDFESVIQGMGEYDPLEENIQTREKVKIINSTQDRETRPPLFEVFNLKTALEAIVEIVYQGEGGSDCTPFVTEPLLYSSEGGGGSQELSHFYRFQEIVKGRQLIQIEKPPVWSDTHCLNDTHGISCPSNLESGQVYCYAGKHIPFHEDGVWPLLSNPKEGYYEKGSTVHKYNNQFNLIYTRLLFCLQDVFGGHPTKMKQCMSLMYDLTIVGKRLVSTPLHIKRDSKIFHLGTTGKNGSPTWRFVRELPFRAGLPLRA